MPPYQQRVVDELAQLAQKTEALRTFIAGGGFYAVEQAEQTRLRRQHVAMVEYRDVLKERVAAFQPA